MTIDEAIEYARDKAKQQYDIEMVYTDDNGVYSREKARCRECAEEHEQLAEWLEELKDLRKWKEQEEKACDKWYEKGRADAIEELKEKYLDTDAYNEGLADGRADAIDEFADYVLNQFAPLFTKEELIEQFKKQLKENIC